MKFDILIIGAGPAGTACALALRQSGLKVAIIDKAIFPRNKTCGDAIPGEGIQALLKEFPKLFDDVDTSKLYQKITKSTIISSKGKRLSMEWKGLAINSARLDWDEFLLQTVQKNTNTEIFLNEAITEISRKEGHICVSTNQRQFSAKIIIGCDGANSLVRKILHNQGNVTAVDAAAIRGYYEGVHAPTNENIFVLNNKVRDAYFWIFPVRNNGFNVGYGVVHCSQGMHIKKDFQSLISDDAIVQPMMQHANLHGKVEGFRLPLYKGRERKSGEQYILCGDAANLVDPMQGHGIDKAIISGIAAAQFSTEAIAANDTSSSFLKKYDVVVDRKVGQTLQRNLLLMQLLTRFPKVLDWLAMAAKWPLVKKILARLT